MATGAPQLRRSVGSGAMSGCDSSRPRSARAGGVRHSRFVRFKDGSMGNGLFTDEEYATFFTDDGVVKETNTVFPVSSKFTGTKGLAHEAEKACKALEKATRTPGAIEEFYRRTGASELGSTIGPG
jgi:hypothetical protein